MAQGTELMRMDTESIKYRLLCKHDRKRLEDKFLFQLYKYLKQQRPP